MSDLLLIFLDDALFLIGRRGRVWRCMVIEERFGTRFTCSYCTYASSRSCTPARQHFPRGPRGYSETSVAGKAQACVPAGVGNHVGVLETGSVSGSCAS